MKIDFKTYWKEYLIAGALILIVILGIIAVHYYNKSTGNEQLLAASKVLENPIAPIVKKFKDSSGRNHAEILTAANDIPAAAVNDEDNNDQRKSLIDTIARSLNLASAKQIDELTQENAQLRAQIKLQPAVDSAGKKYLQYHDRWLSLRYNPIDSFLMLEYDAVLSSATYHKSSWLPFSKPVSYTDFFGDDPRMTINGVKHLRVVQPDPLFGFSADAKTTYLIYSKRLVPSLGATLRMGNVNFEAREYYNFNSNQFRPLVSVGYKIINH